LMFCQTLKSAQTTIVHLRRKYQVTISQLSDAQAKLVTIAAFKRRARRATKGDKHKLAALDDTDKYIPKDFRKIAGAITKGAKASGHHFVIFWSYTTPPSLFGPQPDFEWDDYSARFANAKSMVAGLTAELYAAVPTVLHDYIEHKQEPFLGLVRSLFCLQHHVACFLTPPSSVLRYLQCCALQYGQPPS
jgi:hypothetical protein